MPRKSHPDIPEKLLLDLHGACDGTQLWKACRKLLERCFAHHFVAIGFSFRGDEPMTIKRGKPAPDRSPEWWARNMAEHPLMDILIRKPYPTIIRITDQIPPDEIRVHPYYKEFIEPEGWFYSVGVFPRDGDRLMGLLTVNRREDQGDFTEEEMDRFERLYPHFRTAFRRVSEIQNDYASRFSMATMLSRIPLAVAIVSHVGEINFINDAARRACMEWEKTGDLENPASPYKLSSAALPDVVCRRCLELAEEAEGLSMLNLPASLETHTVESEQNPACFAVIEYLTARHEPFSKAVFLVRFESSTIEPGNRSTEIFNRYCSLTTAEKMATEKALEGLTNREIAEKLGKSTSTVKNQLESVYRKMNVRNRRELISLAPELQLAIQQIDESGLGV